MRLKHTLVALAMCLVSTASHAALITVNFDNLAHNTVVGGAYSAQGVTFNNATAISFAFPGGTGPNSIVGTTNSFGTTQAAPISATFAADVSLVRLTGLDVGGNGFVLKGFDSVVGGNLIATTQVFGATAGGVGEFFTLQIAASGIRRAEFSRVTTNVAEGSAYDNFVFDIAPLPPPTTVPEPTSMFLLGSGLVGLVARRRRK